MAWPKQVQNLCESFVAFYSVSDKNSKAKMSFFQPKNFLTAQKFIFVKMLVFHEPGTSCESPSVTPGPGEDGLLVCRVDDLSAT